MSGLSDIKLFALCVKLLKSRQVAVLARWRNVWADITDSRTQIPQDISNTGIWGRSLRLELEVCGHLHLRAQLSRPLLPRSYLLHRASISVEVAWPSIFC